MGSTSIVTVFDAFAVCGRSAMSIPRTSGEAALVAWLAPKVAGGDGTKDLKDTGGQLTRDRQETGANGELHLPPGFELIEDHTGCFEPAVCQPSSDSEACESPRQGAVPGTREFHDTDLGNARRFIAQHGRDVRYCPQWGAWLIWDGRRWVRDETREIMRRAKSTVRSMYREGLDVRDDHRRQQLMSYAVRCESAQRLEAMIQLAESEPGVTVRAEELDRDPWLLNLLNGTLKLDTRELRPHARGNLITKLAPVEYRPDARSELWEYFLHETTGGDRDFAAFLQRAAGYSLTGDTSEEKLFFVFGPPASGKTTYIEALKAVLGDHAATADFETFLKRRDAGPRNDLARLAGKRFVSSVEVDDGKHLAEGLVKQVTGGDKIAARFLYREAFEFVPQFKLWLAANHAPHVSDADEAIWRRILRVPFARTVPKERRDAQVKAILTDPNESGAAILAWMVKGCREWLREGLRVPVVVEQSTEAYRDEMDHVGDFIEECCQVDGHATEAFGGLYARYQEWCRASAEPALRRRAFGDRLTARGFAPGKSTNGRRVRLGIRVVESVEHESTPQPRSLGSGVVAHPAPRAGTFS